jgi:hypothetical protein
MIFGREDPKDKHRSIMKASRKQEERSAKIYKGSRNAGSGSGWLRKNDVRSHDFLIENKLTTNTKSYTLKYNDLKELNERAILQDRIPVLQFDLAGHHYVVLTEEDFQLMIGEP